MDLFDRVLDAIGKGRVGELRGWFGTIPPGYWHRALAIHGGLPSTEVMALTYLRDSRLWSHVRRRDDDRALAARAEDAKSAAQRPIRIPYSDLNAALWAVADQHERGESNRRADMVQRIESAQEMLRADALVIAQYGPLEAADRGGEADDEEPDGYGYRHLISQGRRPGRARRQVREISRELRALHEMREGLAGPELRPDLRMIVGNLVAAELRAHERLLAAPGMLADRVASLRAQHPTIDVRCASYLAQGMLRYEALKGAIDQHLPFDVSGEATPFWKAFEMLAGSMLRAPLAEVARLARPDGTEDAAYLGARLDLSDFSMLLSRSAITLEPGLPAPRVRIMTRAGSRPWRFDEPFAPSVAKRLGSLGLPVPRRAAWIAASLDHFRTQLRNGFAHADPAEKRLIDHIVSLLAPGEQSGLVSFLLDAEQSEPSERTQLLLRTSIDFRSSGAPLASVEFKDVPPAIAGPIDVDEWDNPIPAPSLPCSKDPNCARVSYRVRTATGEASWVEPIEVRLDRTRVVVRGDAQAVDLLIAPPSGEFRGADPLELRGEPDAVRRWGEARTQGERESVVAIGEVHPDPDDLA